MLKTDDASAEKDLKYPAKWHLKFMGLLMALQRIGEVQYKIEMPPAMQRANDVVHF